MNFRLQKPILLDRSHNKSTEQENSNPAFERADKFKAAKKSLKKYDFPSTLFHIYEDGAPPSECATKVQTSAESSTQTDNAAVTEALNDLLCSGK